MTEHEAGVAAAVDVDAISHAVRADKDALFTWDYERSRSALSRLYEKAKTSQWNSTTDLPWHLEVDQEKVAIEQAGGRNLDRFRELAALPGSPIASWGEPEFVQLGVESQNFLLSQFLHGEQGALICCGLLVAEVPWIDAKYYAATQVVDEARHVEVFGTYLEQKCSGRYELDANLGSLLDDIISDPRWDITYLGMQIMVEGLALAAFGGMHLTTTEPLLKQLLRYVMSDEARHVAFGVLSLQELYLGMSQAEIRERQEFAYEAARRLRNRTFQSSVWERMGADVDGVRRLLAENPPPQQKVFQQLLFSKIVPNCKKLGILDAGDGWLRERFAELGILQFEDWVDTSEEYALLDEVSKDRAGVEEAVTA